MCVHMHAVYKCACWYNPIIYTLNGGIDLNIGTIIKSPQSVIDP